MSLQAFCLPHSSASVQRLALVTLPTLLCILGLEEECCCVDRARAPGRRFLGPGDGQGKWHHLAAASVLPELTTMFRLEGMTSQEVMGLEREGQGSALHVMSYDVMIPTV